MILFSFIPDIKDSLPSKITLEPMEGENIIKLPSPHLSAPALPPIKHKQGPMQPTAVLQELNLKHLHHQNVPGKLIMDMSDKCQINNS